MAEFYSSGRFEMLFLGGPERDIIFIFSTGDAISMARDSGPFISIIIRGLLGYTMSGCLSRTTGHRWP